MLNLGPGRHVMLMAPCRLSEADSVRLYADSVRLYFNVSLDFYTLDSKAALWRRFFLEIRGVK
jgi:hypothetical protein